MKNRGLCLFCFAFLGFLLGLSLSGLLVYIDLIELRMSFTWDNIEWVIHGQRLHGVSIIVFPLLFSFSTWLLSFVLVNNFAVRKRERLARGGNIILSMVARDVDLHELLVVMLRGMERELKGVRALFLMNYQASYQLYTPSLEGKGKVSKGCGKILTKCCNKTMIMRGNLEDSKLPPAIQRELKTYDYDGYTYYPLVDAAGKNLGVFAFFSKGKLRLDMEIITFYGRMAEIALNKYWYREELKWTRALADNTSRVAALGEMYKSVAHEVNNPLAILSLINQSVRKSMGQEDAVDRKRILRYCNTIDSTIVRLQGIIKGLKRISKRSVESLNEITIGEIIHESCSLFQEKFRSSGIELIVDYQDIDPDEVVECRGNQIIQVLVSLLSNAYEAVIDRENPWIKIIIEGSSDELSLSVVDCGHGIESENRSIIFNPFFTTKKKGERTGLGLAISKRIVEEHAGKIYLDEKSKETRITFIIPRFKRLVATSLFRSKVAKTKKNKKVEKGLQQEENPHYRVAPDA